MLRRLLPAVLALCATLTPTIAQARDWPDSGGWAIVEGDTFCVMMQEFEGPGDSEMYITMYTSGLILLTDVNENWTSVAKREYDDFSLALDGRSYGDGTAVGIVINDKKGFAIKLDDSMLTPIGAGQSLTLYKNEIMVDHLDLKGTTAAIATTRRCLAALKAKDAAAEHERQRYANIAVDPFAGQ